MIIIGFSIDFHLIDKLLTRTLRWSTELKSVVKKLTEFQLALDTS